MSYNSILHKARIDDIDFSFYDLEGSSALSSAISEMNAKCYPVDEIDFSPGDVVVDIGGHVGTFSIWLAKKYPFLNILAYEATPINYDNFKRNIAINKVSNITLTNRLVSSKSGEMKQILLNRAFTGGSSCHMNEIESTEANEVQTISLDDILQDIEPKLLKMDVEGHEYEILYACTQIEKIKWFMGEVHINVRLSMLGYSIGQLWQHLANIIGAEKIKIAVCKMSE